MPDVTPPDTTRIEHVATLANDLIDLKRIRTAESPCSIAQNLFVRAWAALVTGSEPETVALETTADALVAVRLGGINVDILSRLELPDDGARKVLTGAFDETATHLDPDLRSKLRRSIGTSRTYTAAPDFVDALNRQPRAGATSPGKSRIILEPAESHGDHCLSVAVIGVILCPLYHSPPAPVFVAGLAHHLHNATLPDSGFAGEALLGRSLIPIMHRLFTQTIDMLPNTLAVEVRRALDETQSADTPAGRAFNAADVIDRVLEIRRFEKVASFTTAQALDDLELVHAGPLQAFHQMVLREARLP